MEGKPLQGLSRRERQVMEIVYASGRVTVTDVRERMPDAPSYSAVRTTLRILEEKGHLVHGQDGPRYVYRPAMKLERAREAALKGVVGTFFSGSVDDAVAALLRLEDAALPKETADRLMAEIKNARKEGR